ncbi:MAG: CCA tRNA nucleotidyltransferase [Candidatus Bostrichicola ureolyticus]|nr:MAG: CCA tRNA nucleotidyltransferase [Candidatus Bostrichicola ureolyticus]
MKFYELREHNMLNNIFNKKIFKIISKSSQEIKQDSYIVGGYVRDFLLGKQSQDIDIVTTGSGIHLAEQVSKNIEKKPKVNFFKKFGTAMLIYENDKVEFVGARKESYNINSRNPIIEKGLLIDDQNRRDFTINSIAISLNKNDYGRLIDPLMGKDDLKKKIIRTTIDPNITYYDDPLRMMRAIRFATQLKFKIEYLSYEFIKKNKERIHIVSIERIMDEFNKILSCDKPSIGINLLYDSGLLNIILPELTALKGIEEKDGATHKDNFIHTIEVIDNISKKTNYLWLRWAALLHDIGKTNTKKYFSGIGWTFRSHEVLGSKMIPSIFRRIKLPMGVTMRYIQKIIRYSSRPIALISDKTTDSAIRRLLFDLGNDIEDLIMLCEADITTKNLSKKQQYKSNFNLVSTKLKQIEKKDKIRNWQPPISGECIMNTFNLKPCKQVGIIKNAIKEAILEGEINNDKNDAYILMLKKGKELGLKTNK